LFSLTVTITLSQKEKLAEIAEIIVNDTVPNWSVEHEL
jgi:hypothetical protein